MAEFASLRGYQQFEHSVKEKARFVPEESAKDFLSTVLDTVAQRSRPLPTGTILYRAQRGFVRTTEILSIPVHSDESDHVVEEDVEVAANAPLRSRE